MISLDSHEMFYHLFYPFPNFSPVSHTGCDPPRAPPTVEPFVIHSNNRDQLLFRLAALVDSKPSLLSQRDFSQVSACWTRVVLCRRSCLSTSSCLFVFSLCQWLAILLLSREPVLGLTESSMRFFSFPVSWSCFAGFHFVVCRYLV